MHGHERLAHVVDGQHVPEADDVGEQLTEDLVGEASSAVLIGIGLVVELLRVVLAIPECGVHHRRARRRRRSVALRSFAVGDVVGHLGAGEERGEEDRVRVRAHADELDVIRRVLRGIEDGVAVGVPVGEREVQRLRRMRPQLGEERIVPAERPFAIEPQDGSQLTVDRGEKLLWGGTEDPVRAEVHPPVEARLQPELDPSHRPLELGEQEGGRLRVVPDVRAAPCAAADVVERALPGGEGAVLEPEAGRTAEVRKVRGDRVDHLGRERGAVEALVKVARRALESGKSRQHVIPDVPGVPKAHRVVVANDLIRVRVVEQRLEPRAGPVREVPGEDELEDVLLARIEVSSESERADAMLLALGAELLEDGGQCPARADRSKAAIDDARRRASASSETTSSNRPSSQRSRQKSARPCGHAGQ